MEYFNSLAINHAQSVPNCTAVVEKDPAQKCTIEYIHAGKIYFSVDDKPRVTINGPAVFWNDKGHKYSYGAIDGKGWDHQFVVVSGKRGRDMIKNGLKRISKNYYLPTTQPHAIKNIFAEIINLYNHKTQQSHRRAVMKLDMLLSLLMDDSENRLTKGVHHAKIIEIGNEIKTNPQNNFDFDNLARKMHISYGQFRKLFHRYLGQGPYSYLLESRINYACRLLRDENISIREVAEICGYDDLPQFSKIFKKRIGLSPKNYRAISAI